MTDTRVVSIGLSSRGQAWEHVRVQELSGREAISEPYRFDVSVVCDHGHELPEDALPGADITLTIEIDGDEVRRVHGILGPIKTRLGHGERHGYELRIVPRFYRLGLVQTQEIYLDKTFPEIVKSKLERHDFAEREMDFRLIGTYAAREFVVQYGETDLAFVSRLAEHVGVSYFFEQGDDGERIVFTDHPSGFRPAERGEESRFSPRGDKTDVFALDLLTDLIPTSYIVQDYNYRSPLVDLSAVADVESGNGGGVVEYGPHLKTPDEAERMAKIRSQERLCRQRVYEGKSSLPALAAGAKTTLVEHPRLEGPLPLLLTEVTHEARVPVFDEESSRVAEYKNGFKAIPADVVYRPERRTPKPRIWGTTTGIVQPGAEGETGGIAQIDSEGRYLVQFHFDTTQPGEQKASHRVRMAQPFAGPSYGMHMPLRRGTEVLLAYTNGDPDRPIIVGALYNAASPSPVVTENAHTHQIKSASGAFFMFGGKS
jgi:type VI secretion system secreted protein VgrG